jgi:hypothetical protein
MDGRPAKVLDPASLRELFTALDRYLEREGVVSYRTRAFAYLLSDGALRSGTAVWLDVDDVVEDPASANVQVRSEVTMRASEGTKYRPRTVVMSQNARNAIGDYIEAARKADWFVHPSKLRGPLFIARYPVGKQHRLSQRSAIQAWHAFLESVPSLDQTLQLDDLVLTGRTRFAEAVGGSRELISDYAGISTKAAIRYSDHIPSRPGSPRDVVASLDSQDKRRPGRPAPSGPESPEDTIDQIGKLAKLRDAKVLTEKEFQAKKRELLARI